MKENVHKFIMTASSQRRVVCNKAIISFLDAQHEYIHRKFSYKNNFHKLLSVYTDKSRTLLNSSTSQDYAKKKKLLYCHS